MLWFWKYLLFKKNFLKRKLIKFKTVEQFHHTNIPDKAFAKGEAKRQNRMIPPVSVSDHDGIE